MNAGEIHNVFEGGRTPHGKKQSSIRVGGGYPENQPQQTRVKAGASQEQIAEESSSEARTIQRYEAREKHPTQDTLLKMRAFYSCEPADLFPRNER